MWAIGYVQSGTEMKVLRKLHERGLNAFVPLGRKLTKPRNKKKPVLSSFKLFPGYIFIYIPTNISVIINIKVSLLTYRDKDNLPHVIFLPENVVQDLYNRDEMNDLFPEHDKKDLRKTFNKNDLVCWKEEKGYGLGFIEKNTKGEAFAHICITKGNRRKISVDLLSLLQG